LAISRDRREKKRKGESSVRWEFREEKKGGGRRKGKKEGMPALRHLPTLLAVSKKGKKKERGKKEESPNIGRAGEKKGKKIKKEGGGKRFCYNFQPEETNTAASA